MQQGRAGGGAELPPGRLHTVSHNSSVDALMKYGLSKGMGRWTEPWLSWTGALQGRSWAEMTSQPPTAAMGLVLAYELLRQQ